MGGLGWKRENFGCWFVGSKWKRDGFRYWLVGLGKKREGFGYWFVWNDSRFWVLNCVFSVEETWHWELVCGDRLVGSEF